MLNIFESLKSVLKLSNTCIDNGIFRLHYKASFLVLMAFSILITCRQYFGDPIDCLAQPNVKDNFFETYCWVHSTYSLPKSWKAPVGVEVIYPGIKTHVKGQERIFHAYYQWVCFVLALQGIFFYVPRYMWRGYEGGKVKSLVMELDSPSLDYNKKEANRAILVHYLNEQKSHNSLYAFFYAFCELLNFVNVVGQIYLMDVFLGGQFRNFGTEVLQFADWDHGLNYDPMLKVFPRMTKCNLHYYGSSGDVQKVDTTCILPVNIINEKIYIFLWFWFILLAVVSAIGLAYRIALYCFPSFRRLVLKTRVRMVDPNDLNTVLEGLQVGDWFLLHLLSKNMDSLNFKDLVRDLAKSQEDKKIPFI